MAQVVLGVAGAVVGGFFGGPFGAQAGGAIGSALGAWIDGELFNETARVEGPRLNDLDVITSTYGVPIPLIYGPENRLSGNVIWSTGLIETRHKKESGGKGGGQSQEQITYTYRVSLAIAIGAGPINRIKRIWANSKLVWDLEAATEPVIPPTDLWGIITLPAMGTQAVFSELRFYQGNGTQEPDPTIESYMGVGETPAYRHTAYVVLTDFQLANFGNVIPNFQFEVEAQERISVSGAIADICERCGAGVVSTAPIKGDLRGYIISRATNGITALEPLSVAFNFDAAEQRGQIAFLPRGLGITGTIEREDLGAFDAFSGAQPKDPLKIDRMPDINMPREASITFSDKGMDYQNNSQSARRTEGSADSNINKELPITLNPNEGRQIADRALWSAWTARRTAQFSYSDKWIRRNPGDILGVPYLGEIMPFKISRGMRGADGVIEINAKFDDPEVYKSLAQGTDGNIPANPLRLPGETLFQAMDIPMVRPQDDNTGFYWVASGGEFWQGATVFRSSDSGQSYDIMSPVAVRAVMGTVAAALPSGPTEFWDRGNTITVELFREDDELEGRSELAVLNGANAFWLGDTTGQDGEIIQFSSAVLVSPGVYELSDLLRGRLGTEYAIGNHGTDEVFVFLEPDTLGRTDFGAGDWNRERFYKPVSTYRTLDQTDEQAFTNTGEAKRPFSPVHIEGSRDGADNLTLTWVRRSRIFSPGLGYGPLPLGEETESYEVDILDGGTVVRTILVPEPEASYSAAEQAADGLTPGDPVNVRVYQISTIRGRGRPGIATV